MGCATDLLKPVADILGRLIVYLSTEKPDGKRTEEETESSNGANPDINEARREVVTDRAKRTPALGIGAEGVRLGLEVAMQVLHWPKTGEGTRMQQALLGVGIFHRGKSMGGFGSSGVLRSLLNGGVTGKERPGCQRVQVPLTRAAATSEGPKAAGTTANSRLPMRLR